MTSLAYAGMNDLLHSQSSVATRDVCAQTPISTLRSPRVGGAFVLGFDPLVFGDPAAVVHVVGEFGGDFAGGAGGVLAEAVGGAGDSADGELRAGRW